MIILFLFFLLVIVVLDVFYPYYSRRYIQFGVSIPEPYVNEDLLALNRKKYSLYALIIHLLYMIAYLILSINSSQEKMATNFLIFMTLMGLSSLTLYLIFHTKTKRLLLEEEWLEKVTLVHVTRFESKLSGNYFSPYLFIAPIILTVAIAALTILRYDTLPDIIPTHWGLDGQADAWSDKSYGSVLFLPIVLLVLQFINLALAYGISKASINLTAQATEQSLQREAENRRQTQLFLAVMNIAMTILMLFLHVSNTLIKIKFVGIYIGVFIGYLIVVMIALFIYTKKIYKMNEEFLSIETDESAVQADEMWKWGIFYFNKDDPSIFVEKRVGIGWTMNFARPGTYIFLFVVTVLPLLPLFFL